MTLRALGPPAGPAPASAGDRRVVVVVCDSLGIGGAPDAAAFGDDGADTLGHVAARVGGLDLPLLGAWGLGRLAQVAGVAPVDPPAALVARLVESSAGKDSTTGHWELTGVVTTEPFPTYPDGFPADLVAAFERAIGRQVLGNRAASGTQIIADLGEEHLATGRPIVYTSADSVFQVATHVDVVPLEQLYGWCAQARRLLDGPHRVGRVIARPFAGAPGAFHRTPDRRDLAVPPPALTTCDVLHAAGVPVIGLGKIEDLFDRRGIAYSDHTGDSAATLDALEEVLRTWTGPAFVMANLVDLDQTYGHRNDVAGYARELERTDRRLRDLLGYLRPGDRLIVTADHGTDPTGAGTDHTRERVPFLSWGPDLAGGRDLGERAYVDVDATVTTAFGVTPAGAGTPLH